MLLLFFLIYFFIFPTYAQVYHVLDFNATGDGIADDTMAIRSAMQAAERSQGGRVVFDEKYRFLTGAFNATSNVIIDVRGTILATNASDGFHYPVIEPCPWIGGGVDGNNEAEDNITISGSLERQPFIFVYNATNVTLTGGGVVDGQGQPWWACSWNLTQPPCNNISR